MIDFEPTLYIEFTNNCSLLEIGSIRTISTGWNLASFTEANTDADADDINHMTWEFSDLPVLHGEGRAVRIRLVSECAQEAGDLDSIEINVSAFPDERGASQNFSAYVTLYEKFKVYERSYDNMDPLDALLEKINDQYDPEISRYMRLAQENTSHQQKTDEQYLDINSARTRRTCSSSRIVCVRDGQRCSINTYLERSKNETGAIFHIVINEMVTEVSR
jgi:outer membrane phospholipase A